MIDKMNLNEEPFERIHTDKLKENLEKLNTNDIVAKINVSNFSDGENSANVSFELPEGVGVDDNVTVRVQHLFLIKKERNF